MQLPSTPDAEYSRRTGMTAPAESAWLSLAAGGRR